MYMVFTVFLDMKHSTSWVGSKSPEKVIFSKALCLKSTLSMYHSRNGASLYTCGYTSEYETKKHMNK